MTPIITIVLIILFAVTELAFHLFGGKEFQKNDVTNSSPIVTLLAHIAMAVIFWGLFLFLCDWLHHKPFENATIFTLFPAIWRAFWAAFIPGGIVFLLVAKVTDAVTAILSLRDGLVSFRFAFSLSFIFCVALFW